MIETDRCQSHVTFYLCPTFCITTQTVNQATTATLPDDENLIRSLSRVHAPFSPVIRTVDNKFMEPRRRDMIDLNFPHAPGLLHVIDITMMFGY